MSLGMKKGTRSLLGLFAGAARAVREQVDREELARIDASLASLESGLPDVSQKLMARYSPRPVLRADTGDPLELLWNLPSGRPTWPRRQ